MSTKKDIYSYIGTIKTDKYKYKISVDSSERKIDGKDIIYSRYFNFGIYTNNLGEKKTCVDIYVMYPELQKEDRFVNYKLAKLITTHHNEKCSIDEKLNRGEGTRHMINTAMQFVCAVCPFVEGFQINDASTRKCDNDTIITLSYFSIIQNNKTWYEKNFNASIGDASKKEKYKKIINQLKNNDLPEWETFYIQYLRNTDKEITTKLHDAYVVSKKYDDFFEKINKLGASKACILIQPWIDKFMLTTGLDSYILFTQWIIPKESISAIGDMEYVRESLRKM